MASSVTLARRRPDGRPRRWNRVAPRSSVWRGRRRGPERRRLCVRQARRGGAVDDPPSAGSAASSRGAATAGGPPRRQLAHLRARRRRPPPHRRHFDGAGATAPLLVPPTRCDSKGGAAAAALAGRIHSAAAPSGRGTCGPERQVSTPSAATSTASLTAPCTASQSTARRARGKPAATSTTGCRVPTSLLASIRHQPRLRTYLVEQRRRRHHAIAAGRHHAHAHPQLDAALGGAAHRRVLAAGDDDLAALVLPECRGARHLEHHRVVGLAARGGEDDVVGVGAEQRRHLVAGVLHRLACRLPGAVRRGGVAVPLAEPRQHGIAHARVHRRRGVVVEVDKGSLAAR